MKWPFIGKAKPKPKWRLVPDEYGTYNLEMWHDGITGCYMVEKTGCTKQSADLAIANLERETIYCREETE